MPVRRARCLLGTLVVAVGVCCGLAGCGASASSSSSSTAPSSTPALATSTSAPPSAEVAQKAAALLHAADLHAQDVFNRGVAVTLDRGQPNSFPAWSAWFQSVNSGQLPPISAGFQAGNLVPDSQAGADWQNHDLNADIDQLANDGADVGGPDDAAARERVRADIKGFQSDFANDERDANQVAAGK